MGYWWRVIAVRGDYVYGAVACYETEEEAARAREQVRDARSPAVKQFGLDYVLRQDGDAVASPLYLSRITRWAESMAEHRPARRR